MSFRRSDGPADRAESERLLDAARAGRPPESGADPLVHLLAAAAAPTNYDDFSSARLTPRRDLKPSPGELSGEEQAVAAFRAARANPVPAPARAPRPRRFRVGMAAWAAGIAATATAGVSFAAVSLDRPQQPAPPATTTAGSTGAGDTGSPAQSPGGTPSAGTSGPAASPTAGRTGGPGRPATVEQLTGMCRAYLAKPAGQRAKALETPTFADLVAAAGGAGQVDPYCARLVPEEGPKSSPSPQSTRSPAAGTAPTPAHSSGKPSTAG